MQKRKILVGLVALGGFLAACTGQLPTVTTLPTSSVSDPNAGQPADLMTDTAAMPATLTTPSFPWRGYRLQSDPQTSNWRGYRLQLNETGARPASWKDESRAPVRTSD